MSDPDLTFPDPPRIELDRRLSDLVDAANEVLATQGRLRALLRASQLITQQLDLDSVLESVVEAARSLTGAQYGALGVLDDHGGLERFIHAGMDPADVERIGHLPRGRGLLGALISDPRPIRIDDIGADPRSAGFPAGHPPMHDFLGVPVPVRGVIYGNLYLSGSRAGAFTDEDEQLLTSLAATAGFAIENARLYRETRRRQEWAAASAAITSRLLAPHEGDAVPLIAARTREVAKAMSTFVLLVTDDPQFVRVAEVAGRDPNDARGRLRPAGATIAAQTMRSGEPRRWEESEIRDLGREDLAAVGPVMTLPLRTPDRTAGAIVVARAPGAPPFDDGDLAAAADFAGRAAVALELVQARDQTQRMLLFEDRGRIARDLHDQVIQQLFATGMQLQGVLGTIEPGRNADRVDAAITSLDDSITQIRRIIFTLQSTGGGPARSTGRQRLFDLIEQHSAALSIEPDVTVTGPVDAVLDGDLAEDVLAVVGEGISNAVKHGGASSVEVAVAADARGVTVTVGNDGEPLADSGRRSGLTNLEERARRRRGTVRLEALDGRTVLTWAIPLRAGPSRTE
ncbi:GAF domain-containing sensor histidine kinase [Amnibacterium sp.]|uniref:GAF domain-containing sensor histidine kinase n=1 Tax=Amnibacterium sp. TaxID=1872496 RepID=UPI003F7B997A